MPVNHCLGCGHMLDAASAVDANAKPSPGDATICLHCRHVMMFDENLALRDLTVDELIEAMKDDRVLDTQAAIRMATKR
jgi:hypothetical protein